MLVAAGATAFSLDHRSDREGSSTSHFTDSRLTPIGMLASETSHHRFDCHRAEKHRSRLQFDLAFQLLLAHPEPFFRLRKLSLSLLRTSP